MAPDHPLRRALAAAPTARAGRIALAPGLDDTLFENDGQLTKREVRAVTLSALAPRRMMPGTYTFTYILRAQIPGSYAVLPSIGMLNYFPDVRGNGAADQMMILE